MPNIVDALMIELGLDTRKLRQGQADADAALSAIGRKGDETAAKVSKSGAATRGELKSISEQAVVTAKEMQARGDQAAEFFGKMRNQALALFAAVEGSSSLKNFAENATKGMVVVSQAAANMGIGLRSVEAVTAAIQRNGGSAEAARSSMVGLARQMQELKVTGKSSIIPGLQMLGGLGANSSPLDILKRLAAYGDTHSRQQLNFIGDQLGLDQGTLNELAKGSKAFNADLAASGRQGLPSDADARKLTALNSEAIGFTQTIENLGTRMLSDVAPVLTAILKQLDEFAQKHPVQAVVDTGIGVGLATGGGLMARAALQARRGRKIEEANARVVADKLKAAGIALGDEAGVIAAGAVAKRGWMANPIVAGIAMAMAPSSTASNDEVFKPGTNRAGSEAVMNGLMALGWSRASAAAAAGNIQRESNFNPRAKGDSGLAYGLMQWHPDRQAAIAKHFGKTLQQMTLKEQIAAVDWEVRNKYSAAFRAMQAQDDPSQASFIFTRKIERPKNVDADSILSGRYATQQFMNSQAEMMNMSRPATATTHHHNNHAETNINGPITIHAKGSDAKHIAADLGHAIKNYSFATQANTGLA